MNSATIILQVRRNIEICSFLVLSHEVSSYLHYKVLYSYPFLGIISKIQCYKIDIKELSSREKSAIILEIARKKYYIKYINLDYLIRLIITILYYNSMLQPMPLYNRL